MLKCMCYVLTSNFFYNGRSLNFSQIHSKSAVLNLYGLVAQLGGGEGNWAT